MKKINNNKFRGNNNNSVYSLNYKFDSVSSAGKFSGTALDLIKRYNELAKEAQSNGNYVEMEVFRQYAEHYRKIVTEINDRKNQQRDNQNQQQNDNNAASSDANNAPADSATPAETPAAPVAETKAVEVADIETATSTPATSETENKKEKPKGRGRRALQVVEINEKMVAAAAAVATSTSEPRKRRSPLRAKKPAETVETPTEA